MPVILTADGKRGVWMARPVSLIDVGSSKQVGHLSTAVNGGGLIERNTETKVPAPDHMARQFQSVLWNN